MDALVGLTVGALASGGAVYLAADAATRIARAQDRLTAARIASGLYEDLLQERRPLASAAGVIDGRRFVITTGPAETGLARPVTIEVERRRHATLKLELALPPGEPDTASSNS